MRRCDTMHNQKPLSYRLTTANFPLLKCAMCLLVCSLIPLGIAFSAEPSDQPEKSAHASQAHWDYMGIEGPEHWGMLTPEYRACEAGNRQSPINIVMPKQGEQQEQLTFRYHPSQLHELNNGHTIQVSHTSGCQLDVNEHTYKLRQFHFHAPSEHHIEGTTFPMEMHLVHQDALGHILVVAVLMEADAQHPVFSQLWDWLPEQMEKEVSLPLNISIGHLLPKDTHHYTYTGSLTTPPCTEGVQWIILKKPMHVAQEDVDRFVQIIGHNARPIQPLGSRQIEEE